MAFNSVLSSWIQNSYVSVAYADDYFGSHMERQLWHEDLSDPIKEGALLQASSLLDSYPTFAGGGLRLFTTAPYVQSYRLPLANNQTITGTAISGTNVFTFVNSSLASSTLRDDILKYGAVRITAGTNVGEVREIASNDVSAASVTVVNQWGETPDNTSVFTVIYPLPAKFMNAVCEFGLEIAKGGYGEVQEAIASGQLPNAATTWIPARVRALIPGYFSTRIILQATGGFPVPVANEGSPTNPGGFTGGFPS